MALFTLLRLVAIGLKSSASVSFMLQIHFFVVILKYLRNKVVSMFFHLFVLMIGFSVIEPFTAKAFIFDCTCSILKNTLISLHLSKFSRMEMHKDVFYSL